MTKEAVVIGVDGNGYATVRVKRESACSHACQGCGASCHAFITARAVNPSGAGMGDRVLIGSSTEKVMKAAAVVYGLPAFLMLVSAVLCVCLGVGERLSALCVLAALGVGCLISVCFGKMRRNIPEYTIVKIKSAALSGGNE